MLWRVYKEGSQGHGLQLCVRRGIQMPCPVFTEHIVVTREIQVQIFAQHFSSNSQLSHSQPSLSIQPELQETCSSNIFSVATFKEDILLKSALYWGVKSDAGIA